MRKQTRSPHLAALRWLALLLILSAVALPRPALAQADPPLMGEEANMAPSLAAPSALPFDQTRYRITLKQSGIYRLTYAELNGAGVPLDSIDPRNFRLYRGAVEVAYDLVGGDDGQFNPGDLIRFYAPPLKNLLTDVSTFWLFVAATPATPMAERPVAPQSAPAASTFRDTVRFEQDRSYRSSMPMLSDVDHWYWGQTSAIGTSGIYTLTVTFDLDQPQTAGNGKLDIELWGASSDARVNPDHRVRLSINGTQTGTVQWDGAVPKTGSLTFPQSLLKQGQNRLTIYMPADTGSRDPSNRTWEASWLNWFEVTHECSAAPTAGRLTLTPQPGPQEFESTGWTSPSLLLYDVSNPLAPVRLTGFAMTPAASGYSLRFADVAPASARYVALLENGPLPPLAVAADTPSTLRTPSGGADYLVISHAAFLNGIQPLVAHRQSLGHQVQVIDVQDIYDEFNGGLISYHAIRDFIDFAYHSWPAPRPEYVLLVGDGTYDFMNREG